MDREELISQLASSMGVSGSLSKSEESRYDSATGTLYCNGYVISQNIIEDAKRMLNDMQAKVKVVDSESRHTYMMIEVAIQAINLMEKDRIRVLKEMSKE